MQGAACSKQHAACNVQHRVAFLRRPRQRTQPAPGWAGPGLPFGFRRCWFVSRYGGERHDLKVGRSIFDHVFGSDSTNEDIYDKVGLPITNSVLDGYNGTVLAYGQTGSGKTYTLTGTVEEPGLVPLALHDIFDLFDSYSEFLIRMTNVEIYNEELIDLFDPRRGGSALHIAEDATIGTHVVGLTERVIGSLEEALEHVVEAERNRHQSYTDMNERSSRGHTILQVVLERLKQRPDAPPVDREQSSDTPRLTPPRDGQIVMSRFTLVDLAGAESAGKAGIGGSEADTMLLREGARSARARTRTQTHTDAHMVRPDAVSWAELKARVYWSRVKGAAESLSRCLQSRRSTVRCSRWATASRSSRRAMSADLSTTVIGAPIPAAFELRASWR
jgi:hypothetical protein